MEKNHKTVKQAQRGGAARSARRAHNPKVEGSNPSPAKKIKHYFFKSWKINPKKTTNGEKRRQRSQPGRKNLFFYPERHKLLCFRLENCRGRASPTRRQRQAGLTIAHLATEQQKNHRCGKTPKKQENQRLTKAQKKNEKQLAGNKKQLQQNNQQPKAHKCQKNVKKTEIKQTKKK